MNSKAHALVATGLASALVLGLAPSAVIATAATASEKTDSIVSAASSQNYMYQSKLVLKNETANAIMIYTTGNGDPHSPQDYYQATLKPSEEINLVGGWNPGRYAAYARIYSTKPDPNGGMVRDKMVAWAATSTKWISAGANNSQRLNHDLHQHETHDHWGIEGSKFDAWVHQDEYSKDDAGRTVIQNKIHIRALDATPTRDKYEVNNGANLTFNNATNTYVTFQQLDGNSGRAKGGLHQIGPHQSAPMIFDEHPWESKDVYARVTLSDGTAITLRGAGENDRKVVDTCGEFSFQGLPGHAGADLRLGPTEQRTWHGGYNSIQATRLPDGIHSCVTFAVSLS